MAYGDLLERGWDAVLGKEGEMAAEGEGREQNGGSLVSEGLKARGEKAGVEKTRGEKTGGEG